MVSDFLKKAFKACTKKSFNNELYWAKPTLKKDKELQTSFLATFEVDEIKVCCKGILHLTY